ncbi:glycosyltransferase family 2 protein [Marinilongibacter aquaticus]|uniref:glycosyltransferase family 2 protein n=1 Tax=Marinilongibacter aquaticus TaxID=2975157 RepID=UPI0021BD7ABB|nr:glycosyltransferase family 2 protein [Marinilongibacter aquaticus]UBM60725.1 glycosyltransferase family 2 protein [Marinilongibacter aquaticus]
MIKLILLLALFVVLFTYLGYGIVLYLLVLIKRRRNKSPKTVETHDLPSLSLVVAAYNEAPIMREKIANTLQLEYPKDRLKLIFITDGSNDESPEIVKEYPEILSLHQAARQGKIAAIHRAMKVVDTEIVVFTDANTLLNTEALVAIARQYENPEIGAVAGEKRVKMDDNIDAAATEGIYWKYESTLKKWDAELYSVVGAAGELFSLRTPLYEILPSDTILDDFILSLNVTKKGYRVAYEPKAYAVELASENVEEELKRKVRISAGGIQSILRLPELLNPFRNPVLSFQYIGHRVLRWTITPFCLIIAFCANLWLVLDEPTHIWISLLFGAQCVFYLLALLGWLLQNRKVKLKIAFIPYYFCMMNYAVIAGLFRYLRGRQSAVWEKAQRRSA